ncbi:excalibur calcium-binding domain-containing protein [Mumia sp. ZJ1417]|nr:excalibur calcium-binding domain-containing protein [Mumia sp. ZJ1417]
MSDSDAVDRPSPTPGWYRQGAVLRWWDGTRWSDATRPLPTEGQPAAALADASAPPRKRRTVLAYIAVAVVAFIFGVAVGGVDSGPDQETAAPAATPTPSPTPTPTPTPSPTVPPQIATLKSTLAAKEKQLDQRETALETKESTLGTRAAKLKNRLADVKAREKAVEEAEDSQDSPDAGGGMDPIFDTCGEANDNGYGPYSSGEPEYPHYDDRDNDGVVCET